MFVDLHIHSACSPCADNDMTPNNIVNMAIIKGLDMICVTDHQSFANSIAVAKVAKAKGLDCLYGVEIQTVEDVHVLCYFKTIEDMQHFDQWLQSQLSPIENVEKYFGEQLIMNENDEVIAHESRLLLQSIPATLDEVSQQAHVAHGFVCLAHVCDKANAILTQLGFIPQTLKFDAIEVKNESQRQRVKQMHPWLNTTWITSSDAHQLVDISEATQSQSIEGLLKWRNQV